MGTRETDQPPLWIATSDLPTSPGHPFYARLTTLLDGHHFDRFVEGLCDRFYAPVMGRPSLAPGRYFRLLLVGYFEGIDSERGMAWRATDSLAVRSFLRLAVDEAPPDHSTIARTRRLIDLETHRTVFTWVQQRLVEAGRLTGKTIAIDATTLEANAAMRSIVRRDTGESQAAGRRRDHARYEQECGQSALCRPDAGAAGCVAGDAARRPRPGGVADRRGPRRWPLYRCRVRHRQNGGQTPARAVGRCHGECDGLSGAVDESRQPRATKRFWRVSRRPRGSRRPRARVWRDWIGSGRRRPRTQTGRTTPTIPMRRSRR